MSTATDVDEARELLDRMDGDLKHDAAATSTIDVLWVLYDRILDISPSRVDDPTRDRFLLSKGHGPASYYAVLAAKGFLPIDWLDGFGEGRSPLGHHPDRLLIPGVEISSGSLGHGLPLAVGLTLGLRAQHNPAPVIVLIGDAELDEGSNHEAIAFAGRRGLDLTTVVIDNASASLGWPGGIARRFELEGWTSRGVNGRDHTAIERAFRAASPKAPHVVIARVEDKNRALDRNEPTRSAA
jgi:transketolase